MGEIVWSRRIADELWSGLVTPLTYSLLAGPMSEHLVRRRLRRAGLAEAAERPVFRLAQGHVYVNASLVAEVMRELPSITRSEGLLDLLPEALRREVRESTRSLLGAQTIGTVLRLTRHERAWLPWSRAELFRREASGVMAALLELAVSPAMQAPEILHALGKVEERLGGYLEVVSWGMIYAFVFFHLTAQMLQWWVPDEGSSLAQLTAGLDGIRTFEAHDELVACAEWLRRDDALRRFILERPPTETVARCYAGDLGSFGSGFCTVLARHGHRLVGRDLSFPTWRERPEFVLAMIQRLARAGSLPSASERRERRNAVLQPLLDRISAGPAGMLRRELFLRGLSWCQEYYALRENMRYHADAFLATLRALALAAGDRLHETGGLGDPSDVFFLTAAELRAALARRPGERAADPQTAARARSRRGEYEGFRAAPPPEILEGDEQPPPKGMRAGSGPATLRGLGVSPGRREGAARVVRTVEELEGLREGEVIVAPMTDPSWTSLLALGGALVLEVGGLLSHGAIVARELGIPAVVDVADATSVLRTGEILTVDGAAGTVGRRAPR